MKKCIVILALICFSCSGIKQCPELEYNSINKLTSSPDGELYTGRCLVYDNNNTKRSIQQYLNGVDYGVWIFYFPNGKIETKGKFRNGLRVGKWKYYYESGSLKQISNYNKIGQREGEWTVYDENGNVVRSVIYE